MAGMARPRVLLADDHTLLLGAFESLLSPECDVVGTASDGRSLVAEAERLQPDVVILDIAMPLLNGLDAGRQIKQRQKGVKLVFVTMSEDGLLAAEAFRAGASAYLLKRSASHELLAAVREVMQGRSYVTPLATEGLVGSFMDAGHRKSDDLTPRQRELLQLLAEGHSMKEVATLLSVTPRTVAFHKYKIMKQLNIRSSAELIRFAITHQIV
jgi:DNA-binding NarL/FixJ family response regulator